MSNEPESAVLHDISQRLMGEASAFRAFLRKRVSDDHVVEDLLQQSLMKAIERHHALKQADNVVGCFYRILRNDTVDYYRSRAAEQRKEEGWQQELERAEDDKVPSLDAARPTVCACLGTLFPELRPAYADLIRRIDLEGESPAAVAKALGVTANNLTVRLHRARQALRERLEQACGFCTKYGCV
ncbi:MAG: sigma-70 family RNA polymerase sigma factor [Nitrospiraceae bacterium]|nr:sigma-70 family RNA polymerase sigma factor [Nitrospiraceae bacterium]